MLTNYLKTALRNMIKFRSFSLINILGFAFSISVCILIVVFISHERSFDSYNLNGAKIYRLVNEHDNSSAIDFRVAETIKNNFPEVENSCFLNRGPKEAGFTVNEKGCYLQDMVSVDNNFFRMFTVNFISGTSQNAFDDINSVILTETSARMLFGKDNPMGKIIVYDGKIPLKVTGVIKDLPENSSFSAGLFVNAENTNFRFKFSCGDYRDITSHRYPFNIYIQLKSNTDINGFISKVNARSEVFRPYVNKLSLLQLKDIYLYDGTTGGDSRKGSPALLKLMTAIAIIILLLAIVNYVNLSVARQNRRNKETAIRKTIGAGRKDIIVLFLTESVLITFISFIAAVAIFEICSTAFSKVFGAPLSLGILFRFPANVIVPVSVLLTGILAGIIPAIMMSSYNPIHTFSNSFLSGKKRSCFRNALTVFQFTISIAMIFCIIVIQNQIYFVKHKDLGFQKEQLLRLDLPAANFKKLYALMDRLRQSPSIKNVSASQGRPGSINNFWGTGIKDKDKSVPCILADSGFISTLDIKLIKGRQILTGDLGKACLINETAFNYFEWNDLDNKRFNNGREGGFEVIGVVKDFHFSSMREPIEPMAIMIIDSLYPGTINVRIAKASTPQAVKYIEKTWKEIIPDFPLQYVFYDDWVDSLYRQEEKFEGIISLFALLAISISCMGILGLAIYNSESRTKEIGIRKVSGASVGGLLIMLNKDLVKWVIVAFFIACPIGWYAMDKWLETFAYKVVLSWWIYALSGIAALSIALLTVSWQGYKAASASPVKALRYE